MKNAHFLKIIVIDLLLMTWSCEATNSPFIFCSFLPFSYSNATLEFLVFFFFFWHRPQLLLLDESFYSVCVTQWDWVPRVRLWEKEGGESDLQERRKRKSDKKPIPRAKSSFFGNIIRTCRQQNVKNLIFEKWRKTNLIFLPNFFGHPPRKPNIHSLYSLNPKKKHLEIKPGRHSTIVKALMP